MNRTLRIGWGSLAVSIVVLAMKLAAWRLTGSVALYSDALETTINVAAAGAALFALWYSAKPADRNHPYGHHKAEYFSALVEGMLVLATAVMIANEAWLGWQNPRAPDTPGLGLALNGAAGVINLVWAVVLIRSGRRWKSPALVAGGKHVLSDVWTTGAVLVCFALIPLTGWLRLDAAVAGFVGLSILWTGYGVVRESIGSLMDESIDTELGGRIRTIIAAHADGALEAHDLRSRVAGHMTFIEFHLVVPGEMTVDAAHDICDRIEHALHVELGEAAITIHVEPAHQAKQTGVPVLD